MLGAVSTTATARIRLKGLIKVSGNAFYTTSLNHTELAFVLREYNKNLEFINNYGAVNGTGCFKTNPNTAYLGVVLYNPNNFNVSYDYYQQLFANGLTPSFTLIEGIKEFELSGSDCLYQTILKEDGSTAEQVGTARTTPMLDVSTVDHSRELYLMIPEGNLRYAEYDENCHFLKYTLLYRDPKFTLLSNTAYIRCSTQKISASNNVQIMYYGGTIKTTSLDLVRIEDSFTTMDLSQFSLWKPGEYQANNGIYNNNGSRICMSEYIECQPVTTFKLTINKSEYALLLRAYNSNHEFLHNIGTITNGKFFTVTDDTAYISVTLYHQNNAKATFEDYSLAFENGLTILLQHS